MAFANYANSPSPTDCGRFCACESSVEPWCVFLAVIEPEQDCKICKLTESVRLPIVACDQELHPLSGAWCCFLASVQCFFFISIVVLPPSPVLFVLF